MLYFFSQIHRAIIKNPKMLSIVGDSLSVGQRVYISGELRSNMFVNNKNQNHQRLHINVNELYATKPAAAETSTIDGDESGATKYADYNSVLLLSYIAWDIVHLDKFSYFCLASSVTVR